jgi:DNA helicase IV
VADTWLTRVRELLPESGVDTQVCVLTVRQAKGLEFDAVIVVDPEAIVTATPRGRSDLYVAMTRATQRLALLAPQTPSDPDIVALLDG